MSIFGEDILSVTIEMLDNKLASEVLPLFGSQEKIRADLQEWQRKLKSIKKVLDDAEEKQMTDEKAKDWLDELKILAYDVKDILDEFTTEALKENLLQEADQDQPGASSFKKLIPTCCTNFGPGSIKLNFETRRQINEVTCRLQNITTQKNLLELKEHSGGSKSRKVRKIRETTSLVREAEVHGREEDKKAIVERLLKDDGGLSVIPITGMEGLGKTTLAQLVYNDKTVEGHFDLKAWACVSEDFDAIRITKAILKSIGVQTAMDDDLNFLQGKLKNQLSDKKFLFVLDDIWNENPNDWELLSRPFEAGSPGSKIIITTRNEGVSSMVATGKVHLLGILSNDDCLRIFAQHSLRRTDFSAHQQLKEVGEKIVKKCNGLPLAAKTLGGLLRGKYNLDDWKKVLSNKMWDLPEETSDII